MANGNRFPWYQTIALFVAVAVALVGWGMSYGSLKRETTLMCKEIRVNKAYTDQHFSLKRAKLEDHDTRITTMEVKVDYIVEGIDELKRRLPK